MQLIFFVEVSAQVGLGHVTRCLALAYMLRNDFTISFCCPVGSQEIVNSIDSYGFNFLFTENTADSIDTLSGEEIVVLDGYSFRVEEQIAIRDKGCILVCIDDIHTNSFVADVIFNHAPIVRPSEYQTAAYTQFALGLDYVLLRPAFLDAETAQRTRSNNAETLLISFGGSDPGNLTSQTLKIAIGFDEFKRINVITGLGYRQLDSLQPFLADKRIRHFHAVSETEMADLMFQADIILVPSSGVLYEAIASGANVITGMYKENQRLLYRHLKDLYQLGDAGSFQEQEIVDALKKALTAGSKEEKKPSFTNSPVNNRKLFAKIGVSKKLTVRPVNAADVDITYQWASNPVMRSFSFSNHTITSQEHENWFVKKLADPACVFYIAEMKGTPAGSIRFDMDRGTAKISYLLAPAFHGIGLGSFLLARGIETLMRSHGKILQMVTGQVIKTNIPSVKAFERLGFNSMDFKDYIEFRKNINYA